MPTKPVVIRLSAENADSVKAVLKDLGEEGQRGLKRIEDAGRPASRSLQLVNAASLEAGQSLDHLAARAGPLGGIARSLGPIGLGLAAAAGGAVALGIAARNAARDVAEIGDAADRAGVAVDTYEQLRAALIQVGQPTGTLESALSALNRRIGEARAGAGEASKVFRALDIQLEDAKGPRSFEEILADIADRFKDLDASQRLALGQKLGEETFRSLVPVLEQGSDGLRRMAEEAERMGLLFGGEVIRSAQDLNIQFERQAQIVGVQLKTAFLEAGPAVASLTENFAALLPVVVDFFNTFARGLVTIGEFLGVVEAPLSQRLADKVTELREVQNEIAEIANAEPGGGFSIGGIELFGRRVPVERLPGLRERESQLLEEVRRLDEQQAAMQRLSETFSSFTPPTLNLGTGGGAAKQGEFDKALAQISQQIEQQKLARREVGLTAGEFARLKAEIMLTAAAQEQYGTVTDETAVLIQVMAGEIGKATEETNAAIEAEKRWEEAAQRRAKAQEEAAKVMTDAIEKTGDTLADMVTNSENLLRRLLALMLQTFAGTGPFGGVANQLLNVTGGGFVSALLGINSSVAPSTSPIPIARPGAAFGDEFTVAGLGGVDSRLLTMPVTPGERVRVDSMPRRDEGGAGGLTINQSWNISSDNPAMVEEVLARHRPQFRRDAEQVAMRALYRTKTGARGTLGRVL